MKTMKKILAVAAAVLMLCSILPLSVLAAEDVTINTYSNTGTLASGNTSISWESGDYQVVSYKNTSSTAIRTSDADHFRYYVGNKLVISGKDGALMSKVVITCTGSSYMLNNASNTLGAGWTVSASGTTLTYTPDGGSASELTITIGKQSRSSKIVITPASTGGDVHTHNFSASVTKEATCTEEGVTTYTCECGEDTYTEAIATLPHTYVDGACSVCGAEEPNVVEVTISFATADQRVSQDGNKQVWQNGAVTMTNNKAASTNAVVSNYNPVRLYANSEIVVDCINMTKIVFNCDSSSYATVLKNSIGDAATVSGTVVTVEFAEPQNSFTIAKLTAQVRLDSLVVTANAGGSESDCEHANAKACDTHCPDCSALINAEAAHKSNAQYPCQDGACEYCGEAVAAVDHVYDENDVCTVCGQAPTPEKAVDPENPQKYVFSEFAAGTQYAENEKHYLDNAITVITNKGHFTSELRLYSSTTNDATAIIKSTKDISAIVLNAGNKVDVLNLYISEDGEIYEAIEITETSYNEYTVLIPEMTKYIKLDVAGDQQVRIKDMTLYFDGEVPHTHNFVGEETKAPTCTEAGEMTYSCECGKDTYTEEIPATGEHSYANEFDVDCNVCGAVRAVVNPISYVGKSVSEDVSGLAMLFNANVEGVVVKAGTFVQADFTNATYNGYKLLGLGVKASNGTSETTIEGLRMYDLEDGNAKFAFRIINIPADKLDVEITMTPYYVVEIDGEATTLYGEAQVGSYAEVAG